MNKKILIGSIITVTVLIGVSFTSVVGYRSVDSDVNASPLFNIRSRRTIDEQSEELSCAYVGKGEESSLSIPNRNDKNDLFKNFIERIQLMNDETFNKFVNSVVYKHHYNKDFKDINVGEIIIVLSQIRDNHEMIINFEKNNDMETETWRGDFEPTICWFPLCFILWLLLYLYMVIWQMVSFVNSTCFPYHTRCEQ